MFPGIGLADSCRLPHSEELFNIRRQTAGLYKARFLFDWSTSVFLLCYFSLCFSFSILCLLWLYTILHIQAVMTPLCFGRVHETIFILEYENSVCSIGCTWFCKMASYSSAIIQPFRTIITSNESHKMGDCCLTDLTLSLLAGSRHSRLTSPYYLSFSKRKPVKDEKDIL